MGVWVGVVLIFNVNIIDVLSVFLIMTDVFLGLAQGGPLPRALNYSASSMPLHYTPSADYPFGSCVLRPLFAITTRALLVGGALSFGIFAEAPARAADLPHRGELVLELGFDDAPGAAIKDSSGRNPPASLMQFDDAKADLRTPPGDGVSGKSKDGAFDNRESLGMGGSGKTPGHGGKVVIGGGATSVTGAQSFTVQGWYRTETGQIPSNYARLLSSPQLSVLFDAIDGRGLVLSTDHGSAISMDPVFLATGEWVFFAIVCDGGQAKNNVFFYAGSIGKPVKIVTVASLAQGTLKAPPQRDTPLVIGNMPDGTRPFAGLIDDLRIWVDTTTGAKAALTQADLEAIRKADAP